MEKLRPEQLREKANMLPLLPGVYIMLDEHGEVIYIGKAKALKNRVTSYFRGEHLPKWRPWSRTLRISMSSSCSPSSKRSCSKLAHQAAQTQIQHPAQGRQGLSPSCVWT